MKEFPKIQLSNKEYDMSSWFQEKSSNVVLYLSTIIDMYNNNQIHSETEKEIISSMFNAAVYDAIKLLVLIHGQEQNVDLDEAFNSILKNGKNGFEQLEVSCGLLKQTTKDRRIRRLTEYKKQLEHYITEDKTARTMIYELTNKYVEERKLKSEIIDKLDKVTMGESSWDEFVQYGFKLLNKINQMINEV